LCFPPGIKTGTANSDLTGNRDRGINTTEDRTLPAVQLSGQEGSVLYNHDCFGNYDWAIAELYSCPVVTC
jgi:hypothetical protein